MCLKHLCFEPGSSSPFGTQRNWVHCGTETLKMDPSIRRRFDEDNEAKTSDTAKEKEAKAAKAACGCRLGG